MSNGAKNPQIKQNYSQEKHKRTKQPAQENY